MLTAADCCSSNYPSLKLLHLFICTFIHLFVCDICSVSLLSGPRVSQIYRIDSLHAPRYPVTVATNGDTIKGTLSISESVASGGKTNGDW